MIGAGRVSAYLKLPPKSHTEFSASWPSSRKRRKIYGSNPRRKLKFLARSHDIRLDIGKSMGCADTMAEGFWPPCVEHRHCGLRNPLFPAV
jgi:hypothetical protein